MTGDHRPQGAAIPLEAHFVWLGPHLPAVAWLAIRAALARGGFAQVHLWADTPGLADDRRVAALMADHAMQFHGIEALGVGARAGTGQSGEVGSLDAATAPGVTATLNALHRELASPAGRADLLRLRILWQHGGVYLDCDAITLRHFGELCNLPAFVGLEHVCLPAHLYVSRNPLRWARAGALLGLRHALSLRVGAGRRFAGVASLYDLACNNAVVGAPAQAEVLARLLRRAASLPQATAHTLYELGPRLLEAETQNASNAQMSVLAPSAFYPLGPEVCADYIAHDPEQSLGQAPSPATFAAHLYDSVLARRLGRPIDLLWLQQHQQDTLLGRMAAPYLAELAQIC